jgi:hypothetical protein
MIVKVGFTGTQSGMTPKQIFRVAQILHNLIENCNGDGSEFHHGDCMGADAEAVVIARRLGFKIHCHPPTDESKRSFAPYDVVYPAKPYLERNKDIVMAGVTALIATPKLPVEEIRSGTWATVRYGRKIGRKVTIVDP